MAQIPDEVRQQVVNWPVDAPHGAVEAFCANHGVSRAWFYKVRKLAQSQGQAAMVKSSTQPQTTRRRFGEFTTALALSERARLRAEGKDYGPDSVRFCLKRQGLDPLPSRSTLVRIFDAADVVDRNRKKRPKRALRRFAARFPNQRWQADAFTETLADGTEVTIIEVIDDATRYSLGITVASGETSEAVVATFREAISTYGRPVLVHTDNGTAFNTTRWGGRTRLVQFLADQGIRAITGRPGNPRSQGKVERSHRTIQQFIAARPQQCRSITELQQLLTEQFQPWYNHHRAHQGLGRDTTPADLYETLPKLFPPEAAMVTTGPEGPEVHTASPGTRIADSRGRLRYSPAQILLGTRFAGARIHLLERDGSLELFNAEGASLIVLDWPPAKPDVSISRKIPRHLGRNVY